jgi:hypothetical protein
MNSLQKRMIARPLAWFVSAFLISVIVQLPWIHYSYDYTSVPGRIADLYPNNHLGLSYEFEVKGTKHSGSSAGSINGREYSKLQIGDSVTVYYYPLAPMISSLSEPPRPPVGVLIKAILIGGLAFVYCFARQGMKKRETPDGESP